jgi:hypothetical protein
MALGTNQKRHPVSMKAGATAAGRRAIAAAVAVTLAPANAYDGEAGGDAKRGHVVLKHDGVTVSYKIWTRLDFAGEWVARLDLGTAGIITVPVASSPSYLPVELHGADRVYVQITTATGPFTNGIDVWLGGNSQ